MNLESTSTDRVEGFPAPVTVPGDGALSAMERAGAREMLLQQGRELAESVIFQYQRWTRCPFNAQESARLRGLQSAFVAWERQANAQCPDLDTATVFADSRLRPYQRTVTVADVARLRRTPSPLQAHFKSVQLATAREEKKSTDSEGIWGGLPGGI